MVENQDDVRTERSLYARYRHAVFVALGVSALVYLVLSLHAEIPNVLEQLRGFRWALLVPILLLSLANYFIRFLRWEYYLRTLDIRIRLRDSLSIFLSGLAMTITPGKVGELLKSLLLKEVAGTPMARSAPVVVAERLTDFLAVVMLAGVGIGTYYQDRWWALALAGAGLVGIIGVLNSERLSLGVVHLVARVPMVGKVAPKLEEAYRATAQILGPSPLIVGLGLALGGWFAECLGYYVVFQGHGVDAPLRLATFLYAFSVIAGIISPGGLGVTDILLGVGAEELVPGMTPSVGVSTAFVIRLATLWFAVLVGSVALIHLQGARATVSPPKSTPVGHDG